MSLSKLTQHSPPPELPHLCLLALFSQMTALDRLSARQVCPQWHHRVRELNTATTTSLTIAIVDSSNKESLESIQKRINEDSIGSGFASYLLTSGNHNYTHLFGDASLPLSMWHRLTPWNTLTLTEDQLNSATVCREITAAFADLTALIFVRSHQDFGFKKENCYPHYRPLQLTLLVKLLKGATRWRHQLRSLSLFGGLKFHPEEGAHVETFFAELINATSPPALPALCRLTLENLRLPYNMPVLAQLKEISFQKSFYLLFNELPWRRTFLHSISRYAQDEHDERKERTAILQMDFELEIYEDDEMYRDLRGLSDHLRGCITRLGLFSVFNMPHKTPLSFLIDVVTSFSGLTSLSLMVSPVQWATLFPLIAQHLRRLVHLNIHFFFVSLPTFTPLEENFFPPLFLFSPISLLSVKFLELGLTLCSHSNLHWLNLPLTMPNLQTICFFCNDCIQCKRGLPFRYEPLSLANAHRCYRDIFELLHTTTGLSLSRLVLRHRSKYVLGEQLLQLGENAL